MREIIKTACFVGLALVVGLVAFTTRPVPHKKHKGEDNPVELFPELKDPLEVTQLEIVQFDEASRQCKKAFEVSQVMGKDGKSRWAIPSHFDYPADAKDHLADAASLLMGIKSVNTAPGMEEEREDLDQNTIRKLHNEYGVVDPNPETVKSSDTGVGTRITLKNKEKKALASLIVGKQVGDQGSQHYVRYPDKDAVYVVDIDPSKLSTKFEDWIERNLLGMNTMDLKQVHIQDYAVVPADDGLHAFEKPEGEYLLEYDFNATPAWKLTKDHRYDAAKKSMLPRTLAADEEIDTKKLDDLKFAIDDLKIVDVERKPGAVPADLRLRSDADVVGIKSLEDRGFFPAPDPDGVKGHFRIVSNKGDVALQLSDGACYVLRFGESTGQSSASDKTKDKKEAKKDEALPGSNRYMFVMAEFNPNAIPKPVFEDPPKEEKKPDEKKPDDKKPVEKKAGEKPAEKKADDKKPGDAKPAADAGKADAAKKDEPKKEEKKIDIKAERERIAQDNKRKQEEYDKKIADGKKHVENLNKRFGDWYYVISDDVYRKIHLTRTDFVKKKEAKDKAKDADGHDHEHDHGHEGADAAGLPPSPAAKLEDVKKDAPAGK